LHLDSLT